MRDSEAVAIEPATALGVGLWVGVALVALVVVGVLLTRRFGKSSGEPVIPLILTPEDGGFVVSSPLLPALNTQGDSEKESIENARDAFASVKAMYAQLGKELPRAAREADPGTVRFEVVRGRSASSAA